MTEDPLLPPPDDSPAPYVAEPKPPRRDLVPWIYGLGFLILAGAVFYIWQYPSVPSESAAEASAIQTMQQHLADQASAIQTVQQHLADVDTRLKGLEQRPPVDLGKITARVDALEGRIADQPQLASRLDTLSGRIESLSGRDQTGLDATKEQVDDLTKKVAAIEASTGSIDTVTKRLNRIARLQEASFALASGRPLGELPNAPAALARYAHAAPPTEAGLRLSFSSVEQAALAAKQPDESNAPFMGRVWDRAQGLVTIRKGDDVMVGNSAAIALNHARAALDAGDLAGAVTAVETLNGQPEQAMAGWVTAAKALLAARSALADMAEQA